MYTGGVRSDLDSSFRRTVQRPTVSTSKETATHLIGGRQKELHLVVDREERNRLVRDGVDRVQTFWNDLPTTFPSSVTVRMNIFELVVGKKYALFRIRDNLTNRCRLSRTLHVVGHALMILQ